MATGKAHFCVLADRIKNYTCIINTICTDNGIPLPSFDKNSPEEFPQIPELQETRSRLMEAAMDMYILASTAGEFLTWQAMNLKFDCMVLNVLNYFDIWNAVPLDGSASYSAVSARTKLPISILKKLLRYAMTVHIFAPFPIDSSESESIQHTALSAYAVRHPNMRDWIGHHMEEATPATSLVLRDICEDGDTVEPGRSPTMKFLRPDGPVEENLFDFFSADQSTVGLPEETGDPRMPGWRMLRFGKAMTHWSSLSASKSEQILHRYNWKSLGTATIVDVGGGDGHDSISLATAYPNVYCVVQDYPTMQASFAEACPQHLRNRISFTPHNFRTEEQPTVGADVYFVKNILHDYSDKYAKEIIGRIARAMKPNSKLVLVESVMPPLGELPRHTERNLTALDLHMWLTLSARERSTESWIRLFTNVDDRFKLTEMVHVPGFIHAILVFQVVS